MEIGTRTVAAATIKFGSDEVTCSAGQSLKIETSPGGAELLNLECPAGKQWSNVRVNVQITETDV